MTAYVALLRAVNVGGRRLIMSELNSIADELRLGSPRTFIASGNLLFTSGKSEDELCEMIERRVSGHMGAKVPVMIRTAAELAQVAESNPFHRHPGNRVSSIFLNDRPPRNAIKEAKNVTDEKMALGRREIYVAYPEGMGVSKLRIPAAAEGTARNMNTVAKLAELAKEME